MLYRIFTLKKRAETLSIIKYGDKWAKLELYKCNKRVDFCAKTT